MHLEFAPVKRFAAIFVVATLLACGKRGDPKPPVPVIPKATSDLVVTQRGSNVILSWSYPSLTTAGKSLTGIRRVVVYRHAEESPISPAAPPLALPQFNKLRKQLDSIDSARLPAASSGAHLTYVDAPPFHAADGRPMRMTYSVVTEGATAKSDLSNLVSIVPIDVAIAPPSLTAAAKAEGVTLTWTAPDTSVTPGAKPVVVGFNVYRDEQLTPINSAPVTSAATTYVDVPPYGDHEYRVTAIGSISPRIESEPSPSARVSYKDLLPPATPTGLAALVETKAVRLVWDPVDSADLAGYKVYRSEGSGEQLKVVARILLTPQPITATNYRDVNVNVGISYFYEVTAVDKSGNESKPAKSEWALAPKTP
jgi:hypothetical protein